MSEFRYAYFAKQAHNCLFGHIINISHKVSAVMLGLQSVKRESGVNPERYQSLYVFCLYSLTKVSHWETEKAEYKR